MYGLTWGTTPQTSAATAPLLPGTLVTRNRDADTLRPEAVLTSGPVHMGVVGDGSLPVLFGDAWALAWDAAAGPTLYHDVSGAWTTVTPENPFPALAPAARHLALAFDQSAHHVAAWETAGQVTVRQWDTVTQGYVYRGPFPGADPLLFNDVLVTGHLELSDIVLLYLSPDRTRLLCRVEFESYQTARELVTGLSGAVLDQVVTTPEGWIIYGENAGAEAWIASTPYPLFVADAMAGHLGGLSGGALTSIVTQRTLGQDAVAAGLSALSGGALSVAVQLRTLTPDAVQGSLGGLGGGALTVAVRVETLSPDAMQGSLGALADGALTRVIIQKTDTTDTLTGALSGLTGGGLNA